jgi:hypothetical protein
MSKYFGNFGSVEDVKSCFSSKDDNYEPANDVELKEDEVLLASYGGRQYEGAAIVIFVRGGKYYECHGSHCSCNGLEGQWSPEETTMDALIFRLENMDEYSRESMIEEHGEDFYNEFRRLIMFEIFEKEVLLN